MAKRIALFVLGLVLALIAFQLYEHYSGASLNSTVKPKNISRGPIEATPWNLESRNEQGVLEYTITAKTAEQGRDADGKVNGETIMHEPVATFYEKSGRIMEIVADTCTLIVDPSVKPRAGIPGATGGISGSPGVGGAGSAKILNAVRLGKLSGHVRLLMTARPKAEGDLAGSSLAEAMKGELKIFFADDLTYDRDKSMLLSPGKVFVRADAANFDGTGLTLAVSAGPNDARRIEFLRVDQGDAIIIHHGGKALTGVEPGLAPAEAATAPAGATRGAGPASKPANATNAATKPAPIVPYRLTFDDGVVASTGKGSANKTAASLTSDHLKIIFALAQELTGKEDTTTAPAATHPATNPAASNPAAPATLAVATAPNDVDPTPLPAVQDDDLVVHWQGPLELRPASDDDLKPIGGKLADSQDVSVEAVAEGEKAVQVFDPTRFRVLAGRLFFHRAEDHIWLEPAGWKRVELQDFSGGSSDQPRVTVVCPAVDFAGVMTNGPDAKRHATLTGPGTLTLTQPAKLAAAPTAPPVNSVTTLTWRDGLDADLALVPDPKNPGKTVPSIRRAVIRGANFRNEAVAFSSDQIETLIAASSDARQPAVLEHLLATGHIVADSLKRAGAAVPEGAPLDGLRGDRMEINTAKGPNGQLTPSQMILEGHATAWRYVAKGPLAAATASPNHGPMEKDQIITNRLVADFRDKPKSAAPAKPEDENLFASMGQTEVRHFLAIGDARVDITPPDKTKAVVALCDTLDAELNGELGEGGALATFAVSPQSLTPVKLAVGADNSIEGRKIVLLRKVDEKQKPLTQTIDVASAGRFIFVLPPGKENPQPQPMVVNWETSMSYNDQTKLALFTGKPVAQLADDKTGQGRLTCDKTLKVQLKEVETPGTKPATAPAAGALALSGNLALDYIEADGNVDARGGQLNPDGTMLTDLRISTDHLKYTDKDHAFETIAGSLVIDDHRPPADKPGVVNSSGTSAFKWSGSLVYAGDANTITFTKDVKYIFIPTKPFKLSAAAAGAASKDIKQAQLDTQKLVANMVKTTDKTKTAASPIGLGGGKGSGNELSKVTAEGWPTLTLGDFILRGATIQFDSQNHVATADGQGENPASIVIPGQTITLADKIIWNIVKDRSDIHFEGLRGSLHGGN